jgi:hypothetical protein
MRTTSLLAAVLVSMGCGRGAILEPQTSVGPSQLFWRGQLTVQPARASRLAVEVPSVVEFTFVGGDVSLAQTGFVSVRRFDAATQTADVRPLGSGSFALGALRLVQPQVLLTLSPVTVTPGGGPITVSGRVMTTAGDVVDEFDFSGRLTVTREPGGARARLQSARPSGALRPYDALELRFEQPVSLAWLSGVRIDAAGAPITFQLMPGSLTYSNRWRLAPTSLLEASAALTLEGEVGGAVVLPNEPQVRVEALGEGWQFTSFEPGRQTPPSTWVVGAPTQPVTLVRDGAAAFRRLDVPPSARRLTLWARALTTADANRAGVPGSSVRVVTTPGSFTEWMTAASATTCALPAVDLAPFKGCTGWQQLQLDVTALQGQPLFLDVSSRAPSFFEPVGDAFLVGEPAFDAP